MPRLITKTIYTFTELLNLNDEGKISEKAVAKGRQWLIEGQTDHDWWDSVYELWRPALAQIGFEDAKIEFSGFWSQGDGASFTADVDLHKLIDFLCTRIPPSEKVAVVGKSNEDFRGWIVHKIGGTPTNAGYRKLLRVQDQIEAVVKRISHRYSHENTCRFCADFNDQGTFENSTWTSKTPMLRALFDRFVEDAERLRIGLCRAIYISLEEDYEFLTSDESLKESADANDYTFDAHGNREG